MKGAARELLRLAIPSSLFVVLTNAYRIVDQYWVDRISVDAQAAVGATMFVLVVAYASFEVLSAGAGPLIARATGGRDTDTRREVVGEAIFGALLISAVWTVAGGVTAPLLAGTLGLGSGAEQAATAYLRAISLTALPLVFTPLIDQAFLAMGDAKTPLGLHGLALAGNIVLTPLLAFHMELGVTGAALASTASRALPTAWGLALVIRKTETKLSHIRVGPQLRRSFRIGLPMATSTALYGGAYWVMLRVAVSPLGPEVNAALGIGWSALEGLSWPIFHGLSLACASVVGRQLGAGAGALAYRSAIMSLLPSAGLGLIASTIFVAGGEMITRPFATDPVVHQEAILYALIVGYSQLFVAVETTAEGVLAGAGDTTAVFWTSAPLNLLRVPMAWLCAVELGWGSSGLWWVISCTTAVKALLKLGLLLRGRWAHINLD